jgi:hypothetical protein
MHAWFCAAISAVLQQHCSNIISLKWTVMPQEGPRVVLTAMLENGSPMLLLLLTLCACFCCVLHNQRAYLRASTCATHSRHYRDGELLQGCCQYAGLIAPSLQHQHM